MNKVILIGRIATDLELRHTQSGTPVANFNLAVNRDFKNKQGEREADFFTIIAWNKLGELVVNNLSKGRMIAVEGRLQARSYDDKDGVRRKAVEVVASNVEFMPDGKGNGQGNNQAQTSQNDNNSTENVEFSSDDVPF